MIEIKEADPGQQFFCVDRYYSFPVSKIYLQRFKILLKLLGKDKFQNLLDIGFGSGIFLPELSTRTQSLFGLDAHHAVSKVEKMLNNLKVTADLRTGSITNMPYMDNQFDCVTCLSVLEFVENIDKAMSEIARVAKPKAKIIIGAPVVGKTTDVCYKLIGKKNQNKSYHKSDHKKIITSAKKYFKINKIKTLPGTLPLDWSIFFILSAENKKNNTAK